MAVDPTSVFPVIPICSIVCAIWLLYGIRGSQSEITYYTTLNRNLLSQEVDSLIFCLSHGTITNMHDAKINSDYSLTTGPSDLLNQL